MDESPSLDKERRIHEHLHRPRLRSWMVWVLVFLVLVFVWDGLVMVRVTSAMLSGRTHTQEAFSLARRLDFVGAAKALSAGNKAFTKARRSFQRFLFLSRVPGLRSSFDTAEHLALAEEEGTRVGTDLLEAAAHAATLVEDPKSLFSPNPDRGELVSGFRQLDRQTRVLFLSRFHALLPEIEETIATLRVVATQLQEESPDALLWLVKRDQNSLLSDLERAQSVLRGASEALAFIPILTKPEGDSRLLLELLNNAELRPGGGFLGSFAIANLDAGVLSSLSAYDVLAVDDPATSARRTEPPRPMSKYLGVSSWFLRDANWSPDFAASSEQVVRFFDEELAQGGSKAPLPRVPFDAVIGITPTFASRVLSVIGSVQIEDQTFTADNIYDTLQYAVERGFTEEGRPPEQRKEVIGNILEVIAARLPTLSAQRWGALFALMDQSILEKQVLFWSPTPEVQNLIERLGWGGRISSDASGDYLMVVDANLAALKTDPAVRREITYKIEQDSVGLIGNVRVHYEHTRPFDWKTTRYRTYLRLYVPSGSTLLSTEGTLANDALHNTKRLPDTVEVSDELGKTVFGMFTSVEPLTSHDVVVRYRLPSSLLEEIRQGTYALKVQKQAGAQNNRLTLDLEFAKKLLQAMPPEDPSEWGDGFYRLNTILDQDKKFEVAL